MRALGVLLLGFVLSTPLPLAAADPPDNPSLDLGGGVSLDLVRLGPGTFAQGSPAAEAGRGADEAPRKVTLTRSFHVGRTAVTRAQWERFAAATGYRTEAEKGTSGGFGWDGTALVQRRAFTWRNPGFPQAGDHPVCIVTYPDAEAFCRWASQQTGRRVGLPTEAQWEYACRAGTATPWHDGSTTAADPGVAADARPVAWHKGNAGNATHPVASTTPNQWGLHVGGNVAEWCQDWYGPYEPAGDATDPVRRDPPGGGEKPRRVLRGGSWNRGANNTRSAARFRADPQSRNADIGFRVVVLDGGGPAAATPALPPAADAPAGAPRAVVPPAEPTSPFVPDTPPPIGPPPAVPPAVVHTDEEFTHEASGRSWGWAAVACPVVGLGVVGLILYRLIRSATAQTPMRPAGGPRPAGGSVGGVRSAGGARSGVRIVQDGFWLLLPDVPPGSRVSYVHRPAGGFDAGGSVVYQPGAEGHFVYTGSTPQSVSVSGVEPPAGESGAAGLSSGGIGWAGPSADPSRPGFGTGLGLGLGSRVSPPPLPPAGSRSSTRSSLSRYPSAY